MRALDLAEGVGAAHSGDSRATKHATHVGELVISVVTVLVLDRNKSASIARR